MTWVSKSYNDYEYPVGSGSTVSTSIHHSQDYDYSYDSVPSGKWPVREPLASGISWNENEYDLTVELDGRELTMTWPRVGASVLDRANASGVYREDI